MFNDAWRIKLIPYDDPSKPMRYETNWYAMFGALVFVGGIGLVFLRRNFIYAGVAVAGWVFGALGLLLSAYAKRRGWVRIEGICVDKEIISGGRRRCLRLLCKFEFEGKTYTVTPPINCAFTSERSLQRFLAKVIRNNEKCLLHVNPKNPLQAELVGSHFSDRLVNLRVA